MVAVLREGGVLDSGNGKRDDAQAAERRNQPQKVLRFSRVADEETQIALSAQSEVAVQGLVWVEEGGGDPCRVEGSGQFQADGNVFPDPRENELSALIPDLPEEVDSFYKLTVKAVARGPDGGFFDGEALSGEGEDVFTFRWHR